MACVQFLLEQGCPDPVLAGHNPAGSSVLPEPVDYQVEQKSQLDCGPKPVGLDIPALEIDPHWLLCVIPNQHGLTMPMHAQFSMQELELWKLTSQGMVLFLRTTWKMDHIVVIVAALDLLNFITRTGKRTRWGLLMDGWNSLIRYYKNNFSDGFRQVYASPLHTHPCFLSCLKVYLLLLMPTHMLSKISSSLHAHVFVCTGWIISHQLLEVHSKGRK